MKLVRYMTPIAAAVGLALASISAHAQSSTLPSPSVGTTAPQIDSLFVAVEATATGDNESEVVNLGYLFSQISNPADGNSFTPDSAGGPFKPATVDGQSVLQIDFGTLPNFSSTFTAGTDPAYAVYSNGFNETGTEGIAITSNAPSVLAQSGYTGYESVNTAIQTEEAGLAGTVGTSGTGWTSGAGYVVDQTCATNACVQNDSQLPGFTNVGTTNAFYDFTGIPKAPVRGGATGFMTPYANATGDGFFYLSSSGDLTYNIPTVSAVPLPAAVWLLVSGLAGFGAISRRRRAAV